MCTHCPRLHRDTLASSPSLEATARILARAHVNRHTMSGEQLGVQFHRGWRRSFCSCSCMLRLYMSNNVGTCDGGVVRNCCRSSAVLAGQ